MRVLVIEDERRLAENVARALRESAGYAVDIAGDGEQGLYLAESGDYDLVVLDLMLPKISGQELLTRYRKHGHASPVLVLTARDEKESVVHLLNSGADDYLAKPFDLGEFLARAKALVRRGKRASFARYLDRGFATGHGRTLGSPRAPGNRAGADGIPRSGIPGAPASGGCLEDRTSGASLRLQLGKIQQRDRSLYFRIAAQVGRQSRREADSHHARARIRASPGAGARVNWGFGKESVGSLPNRAFDG